MYILPTYIDKNTIIKNNNKTRNECLHRLILNKKDLVIVYSMNIVIICYNVLTLFIIFYLMKKGFLSIILSRNSVIHYLLVGFGF